LSKDQSTSIRINEYKKKKYKEFGKAHGFNTLSKLFFASLDVVMRNPSLLEVTEDTGSEKILESLEESLSVFDDQTESFNKIFQKFDQLERFQEFIAKKLGATDTEIKEAQKKDISGEAVFE
jgi:hypothetical protein